VHDGLRERSGGLQGQGHHRPRCREFLANEIAKQGELTIDRVQSSKHSRETLLAYATFCEENDLHLVSDEIYAMSVYDNPSAWDADARHALLYTAG